MPCWPGGEPEPVESSGNKPFKPAVTTLRAQIPVFVSLGEIFPFDSQVWDVTLAVAFS